MIDSDRSVAEVARKLRVWEESVGSWVSLAVQRLRKELWGQGGMQHLSDWGAVRVGKGRRGCCRRSFGRCGVLGSGSRMPPWNRKSVFERVVNGCVSAEGWYLSLEERVDIQAGVGAGSSIRQIAREVGRFPTMVNRKVKRPRFDAAPF